MPARKPQPKPSPVMGPLVYAPRTGNLHIRVPDRALDILDQFAVHKQMPTRTHALLMLIEAAGRHLEKVDATPRAA